MKRRAMKLLLFLLLGAIINVAVAWGCFLFGSWKHTNGSEFKDETHVVSNRFTLCKCCSQSHSVSYSERCLGATCIVLANEMPCNGSSGDELLEFRCGLPADSFLGHGCLSTERSQGVLFLGSILDALPGKQFFTFVVYLPLWPGFAINTIFYAAILWMIFAMPFAIRRRRRIKRGLCVKCAYPVGTNDKCTECGVKLTKQIAQHSGGVFT